MTTEEQLEHRRVINRKYYVRHAEMMRAKTAAWRLENPGRSREWNRNNTDRVALYKQRRRDKERAAGQSHRGISATQRLLIREQFSNCCFKCGNTKRLSVDHHMPLVAGYPLQLGNAVLLCRSCNSAKRDKFPEDFYSRSELTKLTSMLKNQRSLN